jgi:hypothetical protein
MSEYLYPAEIAEKVVRQWLHRANSLPGNDWTTGALQQTQESMLGAVNAAVPKRRLYTNGSLQMAPGNALPPTIPDATGDSTVT